MKKVIWEEPCISRQNFMAMAAKKQFRMKYFYGEIIVLTPRTIYMDLNEISEIRSITSIEISLSEEIPPSLAIQSITRYIFQVSLILL